MGRHDLAGQKFGRLSVLRFSHVRGGKSLWVCRCECGSERTVYGYSLIGGMTKSCGCLQREGVVSRSTIHGHTSGGAASREHKTWQSMIQRCTNPNAPDFSSYGGRGVRVCERWYSFDNFLADMGHRPTGHTLDRFPNKDGNYEPGNCRWATFKEQANNRRNTIIMAFEGEMRPLSEIMILTGLAQSTIMNRIIRGWPEHKIFDPARKKAGRVA
jgi:hypothetical protein